MDHFYKKVRLALFLCNCLKIYGLKSLNRFEQKKSEMIWTGVK